MGYHMAGFEVYGIDKNPQPNYPFRFRQTDVLRLNPKWIRKYFVAVVGSPPCLGYTSLASRYPHIKHDKLIPATRDLMEATGLPYIIENVANARAELIKPLQLCGSSFALRVRRHRLFETGGGLVIDNAPPCDHSWQMRHRPYLLRKSLARGISAPTGVVSVHGGSQHWPTDNLPDFNMRIACAAMGIDWMNQLELNQAIPPIYTYWLGRRLRRCSGFVTP